ncbi:MAG: spinster family MFS transporter [Myxococcota bacterium]
MSASASPASGRPSPRYANYVLAVMVIMYTCNYLDRYVLAVMIQDIKQDLEISDSMVGLMLGPTFAFFYTGMGLPIARWADTGSRRGIIAVGMTMWSAFTALSGFVTNAIQLFVARILVGVGEAAGAAPAQALLSDYFPADKRATALSIFQGGVYWGSMLGLVVGGLLVDAIGWRMTFLVVGAPGLLIALVVRLTVREPIRGQFEPPRNLEEVAEDEEAATIGEVARFLATKPTFWLVGLGAGIASFAGTGFGMWLPTFFERVHDMAPSEIGPRLGPIQYVPALVGSYLTGMLADRLGRRSLRWYAWIGAVSVFLMIPWQGAMILWPDGLDAMWWAVPAALSSAGWAPVAYGIAQNLAPPHMRAVASAFIIIFITFLGTGLGPWAVGILNDWLEPTYGELAVRWSLLYVLLSCSVGAVLFGLAGRTIERDLADAASFGDRPQG